MRENERKAWDQDKTALLEEKEKLKSKLLSLSAEKLKVYNETVQLKKDLGKIIKLINKITNLLIYKKDFKIFFLLFLSDFLQKRLNRRKMK